MKGYGKTVIGLLVAISAIVGLASILQLDLLKIQQIVLQPAAGDSEQAVLYSRIEKSLKPKLDAQFKRQYLWQIDLKKVMALIQNDMRVQGVTIHRQFPSTLAIQLRAHRPVLTLLKSNGVNIPVAKDASLLPETHDFPDLPILRGRIFLNDEAMRAKAVSVMNQLPPDGLISAKNISELSFNKEDGFVIRLNDSAAKIKLGHEDLTLRSSLVGRVLNYLQSQQLHARVIDARFSKKVVVSLRNAL